jgi:hypothetical protein
MYSFTTNKTIIASLACKMSRDPIINEKFVTPFLSWIEVYTTNLCTNPAGHC